MRNTPGDVSKGSLILQNRDNKYASELNVLGYLSPLATILHRAFSSDHSQYDASLLYNLFINNDAGVYTLAQLQNIKSDIDVFSYGWALDKKNGKKLLETLRTELLGNEFLSQTFFSSYWIGDGINHHVLGVLSARVNAWIKMKNSSEDDLLQTLQ